MPGLVVRLAPRDFALLHPGCRRRATAPRVDAPVAGFVLVCCRQTRVARADSGP